MINMTTTRNLPAVIAPRALARPDLAVGSHVRVLAAEDAGLLGVDTGVIVAHRPPATTTAHGLTFRTVEDFVVGFVRQGEIVEFNFTRDELEVI